MQIASPATICSGRSPSAAAGATPVPVTADTAEQPRSDQRCATPHARNPHSRSAPGRPRGGLDGAASIVCGAGYGALPHARHDLLCTPDLGESPDARAAAAGAGGVRRLGAGPWPAAVEGLSGRRPGRRSAWWRPRPRQRLCSRPARSGGARGLCRSRERAGRDALPVVAPSPAAKEGVGTWRYFVTKS